MDVQTEIDNPEVEALNPPAAAPPAPAASTAPAPAASVQQDPTVGGGKNLVLPREAFNARLKAATDKGKRAAQAELDEKLKAAGFSSFEEMLTTVAQAKAQTNARPADAAPPKRIDDKRTAKEIERERMAREQERSARMKAEKRAKHLEAEIQAVQAEKAIRETAILAGVKDVDYAVSLLQRNISGKSPEELKDFDEQKFFETLKEKQPYLFGETVRPVTTGTGGKEPPSPAPGAVHRSSAANGQPDVKKMNRQEWEDHLLKKGLQPPSRII